MPVSKIRKKPKQKQIVLTESRLNKLRYEATRDAVQAAYTIMFNVLLDKFDWSVENLRKLHDEVERVSDAVSDGVIKLSDIRDVLKQEDDIHITK